MIMRSGEIIENCVEMRIHTRDLDAIKLVPLGYGNSWWVTETENILLNIS